MPLTDDDREDGQRSQRSHNQDEETQEEEPAIKKGKWQLLTKWLREKLTPTIFGTKPTEAVQSSESGADD